MVWGGIHINGRTSLYVVQGSLTGLRSGTRSCAPLSNLLFKQRDPGATPHRARVVTDFLQ